MSALGAMDPYDEALLEQWDRISGAIDRVVTALPAQMTAAAELLEAERRTMRTMINNWALIKPSPKTLEQL